MPIESAPYADTNRSPRTNIHAGAGRSRGGNGNSKRSPAARPRTPSSFGFMLTAIIIALIVFFGLLWLLVASGDEAPLLPAGLAASVVLLVATGAREVVMRRAWARYTHELEMRMGGESAGALSSAAGLQRSAHKTSGQATTNSLRNLQQRLALAEEAGAQQPAAHLEAYRLCEQYLASTENTIRSSSTKTEVRAALRAGQERVRASQKHHLLAWVRGEAQRLTHEAQRRASVAGKIETAMRAVEVINEALQIYPAEPELRDSALAVHNFIASVKVAHWVELAERAAFRGRYTRAVARYRDALFYLSRTEMSEDAREEAANRINREIEMLRARLAVGDLEDEPPLRRRAGKKE